MSGSRTLPRVLTAVQAERLGISRGRVRAELRRGNWRKLWTNLILTRPEEPTRSDWACAGVALGGPGSVVSGWDAIRHYGVGRQRPISDRVLVLTHAGANRLVGGVRLRRTNRRPETRLVPPTATALAGLPIAHPARAAADAALDCGDLATARELLTAVVQRELCLPAELRAEYLAGPRQGSYFLRRAVHDVLDGARSVAEAEAVDALIAGEVPAFELNVPVCDSRSRIRYVIDVLWRDLRAALEIDSRSHHFMERDWLATMSRHNALTAAGFVIVHWAPTVIRNDPVDFAARVTAWLGDRARELGVPLPAGVGPIRASGGPAAVIAVLA